MDVATQNTNANSVHGPDQPNGVLSDEHHKLSATVASPMKELPPELEHVTQGFQPLSKLFGRVSQECFNSLNDVITELSGLDDPPQVNGTAPNADASATPEASITRRLRWLDWAQTQRQKFMQLLVILQWGRRAPEVSRLIDINWWISTQEMAIARAWEDFGMVKRGASSTIVPGPDISTALNLLRGQAQSQLSSFDYITSEPLPASKVLDTIRNLNVLLHVRLNLHEDLPKFLRNHEIHDGRVTFKVPNEFEVDLIIADEEATSQFWFVDLRLLLSTLPELPSGNLTAAIEQRVNSALSTHGLVGCFEVLHEFCLTLKISILRQQAIDLSRGAWAGFLKIDQFNRSLVIQYWSDRPGKKNWIQLGVMRGKPPKSQKDATYWPAQLNLKWIRNGKETPLPGVSDLSTITLEQLLKLVLAHHVFLTLLGIKQALEPTLKAANSRISLKMTKSDTEPSECTLQLSSGSRGTSSLLVEPISGKYVLQPATLVATRFQDELNGLATSPAQAALTIERWLANEALSKVCRDAQHAGFAIEEPPGMYRESVRKSFGADAIEVRFLRRPRWRTSNWHLAFVAARNSLSAWVVRLTGQNRTLQVEERYTLDSIDLEHAPDSGPAWAVALLERVSVARITREALQRRLKLSNVEPVFQSPKNTTKQNLSRLVFDSRPLLEKPGSRISSATSVLHDTRIALILCGFRSSPASPHALTFTARGRVKPAIARSGALASIEDGLFAFSPGGRFSFTISADLGSSSPIDAVISRITSLHYLGSALGSLRLCKLPCQSARLNALVFLYAGDHTLAKVSFLQHGVLQLDDLQPAPDHSFLIQRRLNSDLSRIADPTRGFRVLLRAIQFLTPFLRALASLIASDPASARIRVFAHSLYNFTLHYVQLNTHIRLNGVSHRGEACWTLEFGAEPQRSADLNQSRKFIDGFRTLHREGGEGWGSCGNGLVVQPDAVEALLAKIDEKAVEAVGEKKEPKSDAKGPDTGKAKEVSNSKAAPQGTQGNRTQQGKPAPAAGKNTSSKSDPNHKQQQAQQGGSQAAAQGGSQRPDVVVID
ncbi:MAG: hypothetical protein Q9162_003782 [Coniocarpon cinnabarinum]